MREEWHCSQFGPARESLTTDQEATEEPHGAEDDSEEQACHCCEGGADCDVHGRARERVAMNDAVGWVGCGQGCLVR